MASPLEDSMLVWDAVGASPRKPVGPRAEERRLVARLREGDERAVEELYVAYRKPIFGFLVRLARDRYVAEDLFQNTWMKISKSAVRLREDTELRAWIFTIARNEYRSYRRWQMVDVSRIFLLGKEREARAEDGPPEMDHLEKGLASLSASDREVLLLVCGHGVEPEEAAAVLGISHAALRQRLGRARARLKDAIAKLDGGRSDEPGTRGRRT